MSGRDERLRALRLEVEELQRAKRELRELYARRLELEQRVMELEQLRHKEQADVERMEGGSLAAFFYDLIGQREEKLDKERAEARAAAVKADAARWELDALQEDIRHRETRVDTLAEKEAEYRRLLAEKTAAVKAGRSPDGARLLQLEEELSRLEGRRKEIAEAVAAGETAIRCAESVYDNLRSADSWATWDMFGGGMIGDLAKHSRLDAAQREIEQLQVLLTRFRTELADVRVNVDFRVDVDGFMRFADYFFDNLFTDWAVKDRISNSLYQVENTLRQLEELLERLAQLRQEDAAKWERLSRERDELVERASI